MKPFIKIKSYDKNLSDIVVQISTLEPMNYVVGWYRVTQKKGTHLQLQSNVTRSKINLFERFKNKKNRAELRDFADANELTFFGSPGTCKQS